MTDPPAMPSHAGSDSELDTIVDVPSSASREDGVPEDGAHEDGAGLGAHRPAVAGEDAFEPDADTILDGLDGRLWAAGEREPGEGERERDPEAERWRSELAAKLFGRPAQAVKIGRYTVLSRVGGGATGVVYAAHDPQLDRKVALKLLRPDVALPPSRAAQWLAREAKILARLSHPNVVPVYDVGEHEGQLFIALELVEGRSLRPWLRERHGWQEVVEVFVQAGRGLAAAHAAGLVHRDFKPENVLLGDDGRVRVSDFGIARRMPPPATDVTGDWKGADEATSPAPSASSSMTTHRGAGTPGYMAPEQFLGDPVDARTDQFGFCVALHEALYGKRPFPGSTRTTLAANVIAGRRRAVPRPTRVPRWLERVLARGLQLDPERRYPSMDALLSDLERRRSVRMRLLLGAAFVVGLGGAAALGASRQRPVDPCEGGAATLAAVWNPQRAQQLEAAFLATELPYAADSARRSRETIDAYGQAWVDTHARACRGATESAVIQRMHCLQSRLLELQSLGDLLASADEQVVEHAVASTGALIDPAECLYIGAQPHLEVDDARDEGASLRMEIARAKVLGDTGHAQDARRIARAAAQRARDLSDRVLEAEALLVAAHVERALLGVVEDNDAELTAYSAVLAAEAAHRPDLVARGMVEYLAVTVSLGRIEQQRKWEQRAREAVAEVGSPPELMGRIEYTVALAATFVGDVETSRQAALRARDWYGQGGNATRRGLSNVENLLGELAFEAGRYAEALPHYERSLEIATSEMGPDHAWVASAHGNMAEVFQLSGRLEEAERHHTLALQVREGAYGPSSVWVIHTLAHLGDVALLRGEPEQARQRYQDALDRRGTLRRMAGDRPPDADDETLSVYRDLQAWDQDQWLYYGLALAELAQGRIDQARTAVAQVPSPRVPKDHHHPDLIGRLDVPGRIELVAGALPAAIATLEQALDRMESELGATHRYLVHPLYGLGLAHLRRGEPERARPYLERALRIQEAAPPQVEQALRGSVRFALAQALVAVPGRRARALALAEDALADYSRVHGSVHDPLYVDAVAVRSWLDAQRSADDAD